mgnify:CR=1 FL=1
MHEAFPIALLALFCLTGLLLIPFGLPGTWLIVLSSVGFGWFDRWSRYTGTVCLVLIAAAVVGEVIEQLITTSTASISDRIRRWGTSPR